MLLWLGSFRLRGLTLSIRAPLLCRNGREIGIAVVHSLSWSGKGREAIEGITYLYCFFVGRHLSGGREIRSLPICLVRAVVNKRLLAPSLVLPNHLNLNSPLDTALSVLSSSSFLSSSGLANNEARALPSFSHSEGIQYLGRPRLISRRGFNLSVGVSRSSIHI